MSRTIPIRVPDDIFEAIEAISQRTEHTRSYVGRRLLEEGLKGELFGSAVKPRKAVQQAVKPEEFASEFTNLPRKIWLEWHEYRQKKSGKAWTLHAMKLSAAKLESFWLEGHDPAAIIRQSIENGWSGLFPIKDAAVGNREDLARRVQPIVESSAEELF
jgi:predicted DNA-binding protein